MFIAGVVGCSALRRRAMCMAGVVVRSALRRRAMCSLRWSQPLLFA